MLGYYYLRMFIRLLINEAALHKCLPENINDLRIYTKTRLSVKAGIGNGEWHEGNDGNAGNQGGSMRNQGENDGNLEN